MCLNPIFKDSTTVLVLHIFQAPVAHRGFQLFLLKANGTLLQWLSIPRTHTLWLMAQLRALKELLLVWDADVTLKVSKGNYHIGINSYPFEAGRPATRCIVVWQNEACIGLHPEAVDTLMGQIANHYIKAEV